MNEVDRGWRAHVKGNVERATRFSPAVVTLVIGLSPNPGWELPTVEEQVRYATELMKERGYELERSDSWLRVVRRVTFRRPDTGDRES